MKMNQKLAKEEKIEEQKAMYVTESMFWRKSWPSFWFNSSSTMLCKHTDMSIACSLLIVIHWRVFLAIRYSKDSSNVGHCESLLLLHPALAVERDEFSSFCSKEK